MSRLWVVTISYLNVVGNGPMYGTSLPPSGWDVRGGAPAAATGAGAIDRVGALLGLRLWTPWLGPDVGGVVLAITQGLGLTVWMGTMLGKWLIPSPTGPCLRGEVLISSASVDMAVGVSNGPA